MPSCNPLWGPVGSHPGWWLQSCSRYTFPYLIKKSTYHPECSHSESWAKAWAPRFLTRSLPAGRGDPGKKPSANAVIYFQGMYLFLVILGSDCFSFVYFSASFFVIKHLKFFLVNLPMGKKILLYDSIQFGILVKPKRRSHGHTAVTEQREAVGACLVGPPGSYCPCWHPSPIGV